MLSAMLDGGEDLAHRGAHQVRQALAAVGLVAVERGPAAVAQLVEGGLEAGRRAHHAVFERAAFAVADGLSGAKTSAANLPPSSRIAPVVSGSSAS